MLKRRPFSFEGLFSLANVDFLQWRNKVFFMMTSKLLSILSGVAWYNQSGCALAYIKWKEKLHTGWRWCIDRYYDWNCDFSSGTPARA